MRNFVLTFLIVTTAVAGEISAQEIKVANPNNYRKILTTLSAGDTLRLEPGIYERGLPLRHCQGRAEAWITIEGPNSGEAEIRQSSEANCVELWHCSYVALRGLRIQGGGPEGIPGITAISAKGGLNNRVHHILIEDCIIRDWNTSQQAVGISTKTPTWDWTIRGNTILNCGTGLYLGNSNGEEPFIRGVIENNLIINPLGYGMQIKYQLPRPALEGMPTGASRTIIRDNVFIKNDAASPDGDRPNLLLGGFPEHGPGSEDRYEVYGNFFYHNSRESLLQASGRVVIRDNLFVACPSPEYAAITLRDHDTPLKMAYVYQNTIYAAARGIRVVSVSPNAASVSIIGNLIFADHPLSLPPWLNGVSGNLTASIDEASHYLMHPSLELGKMDFHPLPDRCAGESLDFSSRSGDTDFGRDFDGRFRERFTIRGAYAGPSDGATWCPDATLKTRVQRDGAEVSVSSQ